MSFTIVHRTPLDVANDRAIGLSPIAFSDGLFKTTAATASLISPALEAPAPFDRLVGSWNATLASSGTLILQAQVLPDAARSSWSPWFDLGREENGLFFSPGRQENSYGFVDQDTLTLKTPAKTFRYRVALRQNSRASSIISLIAISVSDGKTSNETPFAPGPWVREITVAARSQMTEQSKYRRDICSPTALAMALSHWGKTLPTARVAKDVQDQVSQAFGNWTFNMAFAGSASLMSYFSYLNSFRDLEQEIAAGRPVIASVTFGPNELSGAPIEKTRGHLMLVVGFTRTGDVIVLDPAAPNAKSARRIYRRQQFRQAWLINKRGAAYLIGPLENHTMAIGAPFVDLMAKPRAGTGPHDPDRLSQILYGEAVTVQAVRGDWIRATAEEEPHFIQNHWSGYPGWVRADSLACAQPLPVNRVVKAKSAKAMSHGKTILFSLGTRLDAIGSSGNKAVVRLVNSQIAEISSDALASLKPLGNSQKRTRILDTAALFLGLRYVWGGRSGVQRQLSWGVDCSGLSSLAYRTAGIEIPRDAADQKRLARPVSPQDLKPGDLIFLSAADGSPRITHVMIYAGSGTFIESRRREGGQRETFQTRFGAPLSQLKSGQKILDFTLNPPRPRRIYFGSYL